MRLLEYESKEIFAQYDIPLNQSVLILPGEGIEEKLLQFDFPAIVKSQIAIGGRGKAGLIKIAQTLEEAENLCQEFFTREVAGFKVEAILIEELAEIQHEYYCSIALDPSSKLLFLIASSEGGMDIEEVSANHPEDIVKRSFSITEGLSEELAREVAGQIGIAEQDFEAISDIFLKMWTISSALEAELVEINPLALTPKGFTALDGKMILDDNAHFRNAVVNEYLEKKSTNLEKVADKEGFSFVELGGDIAILANGAGLTMALIDVLTQQGLQPANFLDVGGGASEERVLAALKLLFEIHPRGLVINIFGGITRCDVVAAAVVAAVQQFPDVPPLVIRLTGTNEIEGVEILNQAGLNAYKDLLEAVAALKEKLNVVAN
ncbi:MAG TPA: succinate--CoA ligase subunit beta [Candidatus Lokiarchaeia archaeon]|nr:succinate--CoA ligase subunit beta [Candidatus Lokiarchaeia archaeon]